jgi:hypothetical protein
MRHRVAEAADVRARKKSPCNVVSPPISGSIRRRRWDLERNARSRRDRPQELFDKVEERAQKNEAASKAPTARGHAGSSRGRTGRFYVLRGRVRCGICGRRMEGCNQRGNNRYRCQYVTRRGVVATDLAGHPRVLGIKEDKGLDAVNDFLAERLFGPTGCGCCATSLQAPTEPSGSSTTHRPSSLPPS